MAFFPYFLEQTACTFDGRLVFAPHRIVLMHAKKNKKGQNILLSLW